MRKRPERARGRPQVPPELPAELPQFPLMLPNRRRSPPEFPKLPAKSTEPPQSSPEMPPMAETAAAAAPSPGDWRKQRVIVVQLSLACAKAVARNPANSVAKLCAPWQLRIWQKLCSPIGTRNLANF